MDPLTMIVSALAAGAAAGLKPTAEKAIKDAYEAVKGFVQRKYPKVDLTPIERKPESEAKRESVQEDLAETGAEKDQELLKEIMKLVEALKQSVPATAAVAAIGIDLKEIKTGSLKVRKVVSEGTGVKVEKSEFRGDIELGEVWAGKGGPSGNP